MQCLSSISLLEVKGVQKHVPRIAERLDEHECGILQCIRQAFIRFMMMENITVSV